MHSSGVFALIFFFQYNNKKSHFTLWSLGWFCCLPAFAFLLLGVCETFGFFLWSLSAGISLLFCKVIMWLWPIVLSLYLIILCINKSLISCYLLILLSSTSDPTLHNQNAWNISLLWVIPLSLLQLWHLNFSDCQGLKWRIFWDFFVWPESSAWWT